MLFCLQCNAEERHNIAEENQDLAGVLLSRLVTYAKSMELRVIGVSLGSYRKVQEQPLECG